MRSPLISVLAAVAALSVACSGSTKIYDAPAPVSSGGAVSSSGSVAPSGSVASGDEVVPDDVAASGGAGDETTPTTSSNRTAYPLTIDNCGFPVTFDRAPERVIAIKSTSIEMMFALGLANRLVGVAFPDGPYAAEWAPATPPHVITDKVPSQEATLALSPDLVYAGWESNLTADGAGDRGTLASLGVGTLVSPAACQEPEYQPHPLTWDDIWAEILLVGEIFDVQDRAAELVAELQQRLAAISADTHTRSALWYSSGTKAGIPFVGAGAGNPQIVMDAVGLTNIAADIDMTWSSMSWESIIEIDPDVIVVVDSSWGPADWKIETFAENPAIASLSAVRGKRYVTVPFAAGEAGVRSVEAAETLAAQLAELPAP